LKKFAVPKTSNARAGSRNGLRRAGGLLLVGLGLLTAVLVFFLPAERTIEARFKRGQLPAGN
jgi:hypothetical protein